MKKASEVKKPEQKVKKSPIKNVSNKKPKPKLDLWFNDIDDAAILDSIENNHCSARSLIKPNSYKGVTEAIAIDCEFVGTGWEGKNNMLARVSVVNENGHTLLDSYVKPIEKVVDYRTDVSGILPEHLKSDLALDLKTVCDKTAKLMKDRIVVGHAITNDLKALFLDHPRRMIRDTSKFKLFVKEANGRTPGLKLLSRQLLGIDIQDGEHDSVIDARATMRLYQHVKHQWEKSLITKKIPGIVEGPKLTGKEKHAKVVQRKKALAAKRREKNEK